MQDKPINRPSRNRGIYFAALVCAIGVGVSALAYFTRPEAPEQMSTGAPTQSLEGAVRPERESVDTASVLPESKPEPETKPEPTPEPAPEPTAFTIQMPVEGDLVQLYAMNHLSYDPTTRDWRTHDGIDIRAAVGAEVRSAAAGTVASVEQDGPLGTVVTIRHEGGYLSRYANLDPSIDVEAGQHVDDGEVIGCIGTSALMEAGQESHLHFALCADGESVDPTDYFAW